MALFTSCYEEDTLTPTEGGIELRFKSTSKEIIVGTMTSPKYTKTIMYILFIKICKGLILIAAGQAYHMVVATKAKAV